MEEKETIRKLYFIKRYSVRRIAREFHYSRKTVRKAITDAAVPRYHRSAARASPVVGPYLGTIRSWLESDKNRPAKQRHTAHRIYERLVAEHEFSGAECTVREHVAKLKETLHGLAIPLEFNPEADAQCDWGEAQVIMAGKPIAVQVLCMKLSYSGKPFVMAFPTQRQEAFFEGQRRAFEWYEGVPRRIGYDNLTLAVRKILQGRNREEQKSFIAFRSHYVFESNFAMRSTPREQGRVESLVGYMRRNYFVPVPEVASFEELNRILLSRLESDDGRISPEKKITIGEAWREEKPILLALPRFSHPCCITRLVKARHLSMVSFDGNRYSVPVEYGFRKLTLHACVWRIEIASGDHIVAVHERCYDKGHESLDVNHYLPLLLQRPGAFPYARPVRQWKMPAVYREVYELMRDRYGSYGIREFLRVLAIGRICGKDVLETAMSQALAENRVNSERIRQLTAGDERNTTIDSHRSDPLTARVILPSLSQFDRLRATVAVGGGEEWQTTS